MLTSAFHTIIGRNSSSSSTSSFAGDEEQPSIHIQRELHLKSLSCGHTPQKVTRKRFSFGSFDFKQKQANRGEKRSFNVHQNVSSNESSEENEKKVTIKPQEQQQCEPLNPLQQEQDQYRMVQKINELFLSLPKEDERCNTTTTESEMDIVIVGATFSSCFHGRSIPEITFLDYIVRAIYYSNLYAKDESGINSTGVRCAILALEYLRRGNIKISAYSIHRLFITAFILAIKSTDDYPVSNGYFSKVAGCTLDCLNLMESTLCGKLNWNLHISADVYHQNFQEIYHLAYLNQ